MLNKSHNVYVDRPSKQTSCTNWNGDIHSNKFDAVNVSLKKKNKKTLLKTSMLLNPVPFGSKIWNSSGIGSESLASLKSFTSRLNFNLSLISSAVLKSRWLTFLQKNCETGYTKVDCVWRSTEWAIALNSPCQTNTKLSSSSFARLRCQITFNFFKTREGISPTCRDGNAHNRDQNFCHSILEKK